MSRFSFEGLHVPLDHRSAAARLARCLPPVSHAPLEPLGEGDFCIAFRQSTRVVRVARHAEAAAALRREARVLAEIADHLPLAVPRPEFLEPDGCPPFSVHEEVRGEALTRDGWLAMPAAERNQVAADLAAFLGSLHALPRAIGRRCGLGVLNAHEAASSLVARIPRLYPLLDGRLQHRLAAVLDHCVSAESDRPEAAPVLVHGDIAPGHLLVDPSTRRLTGVIDFGDLVLGDPARDFIYIYEDFGADLLEAVLAHYAREPAASILPRIRLWYLLETADWTTRAHASGREDEWREGLDEIRRELTGVDGPETFPGSSPPAGTHHARNGAKAGPLHLSVRSSRRLPPL